MVVSLSMSEVKGISVYRSGVFLYFCGQFLVTEEEKEEAALAPAEEDAGDVDDLVRACGQTPPSPVDNHNPCYWCTSWIMVIHWIHVTSKRYCCLCSCAAGHDVRAPLGAKGVGVFKWLYKGAWRPWVSRPNPSNRPTLRPSCFAAG